MSASLDAPSVTAIAETAPVASVDDAADDPAIWVNRDDPAASLILGTDKQAGLYTYDLSGAIVQFLAAGELNNVDLRQSVKLGAWTGDIAAASNRSDNTVTLFAIDADGKITETGSFPSLISEPYGLCMGLRDGGAFVFVAYKTGDLIMYRLTGPGGGEEHARLKFDSQLEGCVFDDETGVLFVGEENRGVWRADYTDGGFGPATIVDEVRGATGTAADIEGLALYKTGAQSGYLLASSQGNNSYAVYRREGANEFVTRFSISPGARADGAEETDGIEAIAANLGPDFPQGIFVAQDGFNAPSGSPQNFKIVDWRDIEALIEASAVARD